MQLKEQKLLTFLFQLIDVQIKKYEMLTKIGVGPDANINAELVHSQVKELIDLIIVLLSYSEQNIMTDEIFTHAFLQVKFYLDQEYLRGKAGVVIDENNVHNAEFDRICQQEDELEQLQLSANIIDTEYKPETDTQKQLQHDSHEIAFLILDSAAKLIENPDADLSHTIPKHALNIMRQHASENGRYQQPAIKEEIYTLHEASKMFLQNSNLQKSKLEMYRTSAVTSAYLHRIHLHSLLQRFDAIVPQEINSKNIKWYNIGKTQSTPAASEPKKLVTANAPHASFFKIAAVTATCVAITGIAYKSGFF